MTPKIIKGKSDLHKVEKGIGEYFFERADYFGDWTFQIQAETGESQSFLEVRKRSVKAAIELQKLGIQKKDVIFVCCYNDLDSVIPWFAGIFVDAIICTVDTEQNVTDINSTLALTKPKVVFTVDSVLKTIENGLNLANHKTEIIVMGKSKKSKQFSDIMKAEYEEEKSFKPLKVNIKETAFIFLSSGTTSTPKCIEINHYGFMHFICKIPQPALIDKIDPEVQRTNFSWTVAALTTMLTCAKGTPKLLISDLRAVKTLEFLAKYKVNNIATGSAYDILDELENTENHYDLSHLKCILNVGNKIHRDTILKLRKMLPKCEVFNSYGSTEMGVITSFDSVKNDPKALEKVDSIGVPNDNVELKVVDIKTREPLGANQEGEIMVKTPFGMNGYYKSKEVLPLDEDGFYRSQDLGYYDEDGYFYLTERVNESFKTRVNNSPYVIHPSVIENVFLKHPSVKQVSVFDVPNLKSVNNSAALVVLKNKSENLNQILEFVNSNVPEEYYKVTGGVKAVDILPKTIREKVPKRVCREIFLKL